MSRLITLRNTIPARERKGGSLSTFLVPSGASFNRPLTSLIQGAPQWHRWASWDREVAFIFSNNTLMLIASNTIVMYKLALVIGERKKKFTAKPYIIIKIIMFPCEKIQKTQNKSQESIYKTLTQFLKCDRLHPSGALSGMKQMLRTTSIWPRFPDSSQANFEVFLSLILCFLS